MIRVLTFVLSAWIGSTGTLAAQVGVFQLTRITPIVGIGPNQTVRLNVLNPGTGAPLLGVRCSAILNLMSDQGGNLKTGSFTIDPGKGVFIEFTPDSKAGRVEVYALVSTLPIGSQQPTGFCTMIPTVQVIDSATGNTVAVVTQSSIRPPGPADTGNGGADGSGRE
jgi:hypothetical protein